MKGLEIRQTSYDLYGFRHFVQLKIEEQNFARGSFSRLPNQVDGGLWNSTIQSIATKFKLQIITDESPTPPRSFNADDIPF
jgi:hypothetical protein